MTKSILPILLVALALPARADDDDKHYLDFCRRVESTLAKGKSFIISARLDKRGILERGRLGLPRTVRVDAAVEGLEIKLDDIGKQIEATVRKGGSYHFLRLLPADPGQRRALFRWVWADGWTYQRLSLKRGDGLDREPTITDIYDHRQATWLSLTVRRALLPLVANAAPAALQQLPRAEQEWLRHRKGLDAVTRRFGRKQFAQAMTVYTGLPRSLQRERTLMLTRVRAALDAVPADLAESLKAYRKHHPGDIAAELAVLDRQLAQAKDRADAALATLDRIARATGPDAWLDLRRAEAVLAAGRTAAGRAYVEQALKREPGLQQAHWAMLDLALAAGDHPAVAARLIALESRFGATFDNLERQPMFAAFVRSPAFATWRDRKKPPPK